MNKILLLGAGFSRNWGGWLAKEAFEYLLGCPEVVSSSRLRQLLWQHQSAGGFEDALAALQEECRRSPSAPSGDLIHMQSAVGRMFDDMNRGYRNLTQFEFQQFQAFMVRTFLIQFDAIFSLNQDLLLELHYMNQNVMLGSANRWQGSHCPGMKIESVPTDPMQPRALGIWKANGPATPIPGLQPIYKLHGSSNWRDPLNANLMVIGGDKTRQIGTHPILVEYAEAFDARLAQVDARLLIIGYGFRDHHINRAIERAVYANGLKFFVICPEGSDAAHTFRSSIHPGAALTTLGYDLADVFSRGLMGASRRGLGEIFGNDNIEHDKVMRFLQ